MYMYKIHSGGGSKYDNSNFVKLDATRFISVNWKLKLDLDQSIFRDICQVKPPRYIVSRKDQSLAPWDQYAYSPYCSLGISNGAD